MVNGEISYMSQFFDICQLRRDATARTLHYDISHVRMAGSG